MEKKIKTASTRACEPHSRTHQQHSASHAPWKFHRYTPHTRIRYLNFERKLERYCTFLVIPLFFTNPQFPSNKFISQYSLPAYLHYFHSSFAYDNPFFIFRIGLYSGCLFDLTYFDCFVTSSPVKLVDYGHNLFRNFT